MAEWKTETIKILCLRAELQHVLITCDVPGNPHEKDLVNVPAEAKALPFLGPNTWLTIRFKSEGKKNQSDKALQNNSR